MMAVGFFYLPKQILGVIPVERWQEFSLPRMTRISRKKREKFAPICEIRGWFLSPSFIDTRDEDHQILGARKRVMS